MLNRSSVVTRMKMLGIEFYCGNYDELRRMKELGGVCLVQVVGASVEVVVAQCNQIQYKMCYRQFDLKYFHFARLRRTALDAS